MADQEWLRDDELPQAGGSLTPEERTELLKKAGQEDGDATLPDSAVNPLQGEDDTGPRPTRIKFPSGAVAGSFEGLIVSHYQIGKLIGHGGMGEVYSANDILLHRSVAVKFLLRKPSDGEAQEEALLSEARSIASVGHPSICTVYNFGEFKGRSFLVLELLEGRPLDQELREGPLAVADFLDLAIQTCDGLSAAHQKGTVHRDVKPSNLYVCKSPRRIKILDFGLARSVAVLRESSPKLRTESLDPGTDETLSLPLLAGTVPYMSPEQIRGHGVDCRSDIFSLGTVFYQILTGSTPFEGPDPESTLTRILSRDPTPPRKLRPAIPAPIERIVMKMLQRDTELRYQSIDEVRNELATFRTGLSAPPERPPSHPNRWVLLAAVVFLLLATAVGLNKIRHEPQAILSAPRVSKVWSTDTPGQETTPSISKDGRSVVFASNRTGRWNLYRQDVGNREAARLTADDQAEETEPALSPDGKMIAFSSRGGGQGEGVFVRNLDGSNTVRIAPFGHQPTWSPDAKRLAFVDEALLDPKRTVAESSGLWTATLSGEPRRIYPDARQPKWSPHGNRIAFVSVQGGRRVLQTISANGGIPEFADNSQSVDWSPDWSSDGQYLYFCSDRNRSMNLWRRRIDENSGKVQAGSEPVTVQDDYIGHLSISRGTNRIAYMQDLSRTTMYRIQVKGQQLVGDPQPLPQASSHALLAAGLNPSPDGKSVAFASDRYVENIFLADVHTGARRQLISSPWHDRVPRWSPDGKQIAFQSQRSGRWEIWLMRADGSGARQLTSTGAAHGVVNPVWAPDGHRLAFSEQGGHVTILELSRPHADGSFGMTALPPPKENGNVFFAKHWSPCGDFLAGSLHRRDGTALGIAIQNIGTGEIIQVTGDGGEAPNWLNDCAALVYRTANESLSIVDTHTKTIKSLALPAGFHIFDSIGVTKDASWLFFTDLASETDVVVASLDQN